MNKKLEAETIPKLRDRMTEVKKAPLLSKEGNEFSVAEERGG
jgi:hypothetical protein